MVCIEKFNKSTRKPVTCPYCETSVCRTCMQTCILQDAMPACVSPECKKGWSDEFLASAFTKVWIDTEYRQHREKILLDQEKARLPETQEQAAIYVNAKALVAEIKPRIQALEQEMDALPIAQQRKALRKEMYDYSVGSSAVLRNAAREQLDAVHKDALKESLKHRTQLKKLRTEAYKIACRHVENYGADHANDVVLAPNEKKWTFVGKCPKTECLGFVGMDYVCGLCKVAVCKECMEPNPKESVHTCNSDHVLNVKAMRKEAKPCPKCASMISKIDGCDQMWCTQCHTAFSWRTGAEEAMVHNPHFYEWMRRTGQQMAPGAVHVGGAGVAGAAGAPCGFGGVWNAFQLSINAAYSSVNRQQNLTQLYAPKALNTDKDYLIALRDILRVTLHVNNWVLTHLNDLIRADVRVDSDRKRVLRVRRLANEITEEEWKKPLEQMERGSKRRHAFRDVYDMYIQASTAIMQQFSQAVDATHAHEDKAGRSAIVNSAAIETFKQYEALVKYVNAELHKIGNRFHAAVQYVSEFTAPAAATPV